ncbi:hypothetical protein J2Y48_002077 [Mycoplana sp. BE70]|uniref:DUF1643 domain-containing protein n=1 Tax=Mycoplana sp. BE70 TaxID=2817775 RepID=UPI002855D68B|nr:DUF1643 domain-containing protein [Mycoplana sp. BE70]MDR6756784.1 hypothetical protein [Mycoplana sp. BE70]
MSPGRAFPPCERAAVFSRCGRYRYTLDRRWSEDGGQLVWIMLNPSRADGDVDDATIRRCMCFTRFWGYGALIVVNLYAQCATKPKELMGVADPVGPDNDFHLARICAALSSARRRAIIAAWGAHPLAQARAGQVLSIAGRHIDCLGLTGTGYPRHPLYVPATQPRVAYCPPAMPFNI